jgi:hypothetical protein
MDIEVNSGEIFFRSNPHINERGEMLDGIGKQLMEFLASGQDVTTVKAKNTVTSQDLREARKRSMESRKARCQILRDTKQTVRGSSQALQSRAQLFSSRYDAALIAAMRKLDRHLVALILRYYALLEEEYAIHDWRMCEERRICDRLQHQVNESNRLSMFALYLEHETSGRVLLKRLPNSNPQFLRCRRAATENVKQSFFSGSEYSGISVLDVYKIENSLMLKVFQSEASKSEPGKVKGLFCGVPTESLEKVVVYGMHSQAGAQELFGDCAFRQSWFSLDKASSMKGAAASSKSGGGDRHASEIVSAAPDMPFPRAFSRHSTLEEDREMLHQPISRDAKASGSRNSTAASERADRASTSSPPPPPPGAARASKIGGDSADADPNAVQEASQIRYLALCRVLIGKVFVTSKAYEGFPPVAPDAALDSMYNPAQEEYLILNGAHVLPEFLVQYKYTTPEPGASTAAAKGGADQSTAAATGGGGGRPRHSLVPCNLSTQQIDVPTVGSLVDLQVGSGGSKPSGAAGRASSSGSMSDESPISAFPLRLLGDETPGAGAGALGAAKDGDSSVISAAEEQARMKAEAEDSLPWDRIRYNAQQQREKMMKGVEAHFAAFWSEAEQLWAGGNSGRSPSGRRSLQAGGVGGRGNDAALVSINAAEEEIGRLEADLLKQTARRRELERDCAARGGKSESRRQQGRR